jgi:ABC-type phosphate transport system substrate-binding protein
MAVRMCVIATALALLAPAGSRAADPPYMGFECKRGFGDEVTSIGSRAHIPMHYRLLISRYQAPVTRKRDGRLANFRGGCREDVQGLIHYEGTRDDAVIDTIIRHSSRASDALGRIYYFYSLDRALSSQEKQSVENADSADVNPDTILQIPVAINGIAVAHNLRCSTGNLGNRLHLTSFALSQIFSGLATKWNDSAITATNRGLLNGCDRTIRLAMRADDAEETAIFKRYLAGRNPQWNPYVVLNTRWPPTVLETCRGGGDDGMAACIRGQPDSIGYVSFPTMARRGLRTAWVENLSGSFEQPTTARCTEAGKSIPSWPPADADWGRVSLTDSSRGYPVCGIQFGLVFRYMNSAYNKQIAPTHVRTVKDYFKWAVLAETQNRLRKFVLAALPPELRQVSEDAVQAIAYTRGE